MKDVDCIYYMPSRVDNSNYKKKQWSKRKLKLFVDIFDVVKNSLIFWKIVHSLFSILNVSTIPKKTNERCIECLAGW